MKILLVEPFYGGSHRQWALGYQRFSAHDVEILSLRDKYWKWRMRGGAVALAEQFIAKKHTPDAVVATDMLDLSLFKALTAKQYNGPYLLYMHENQLLYPGQKGQAEDYQYAFTNYTSCLVADKVFFNSHFHRDGFLEALHGFLHMFPDNRGLHTIQEIEKKSEVLPLGIDLKRLDSASHTDRQEDPPLLLWNHRWEHDKNPDLFFDTLCQADFPFQLSVVGERYANTPEAFEKGRDALKDKIVQWGFLENGEDYAKQLWSSSILPVTSNHDFFGVGLIEALYCGVLPLVPNRMVYPEQIPEKLKPYCIYAQDEAFGPALEALINEQHSLSRTACRASAERFDWNQLIPRYDKAFKLA